MLQAYATKRILDIYHIENETIMIDDNIDFKKGKRKYYIRQIFNFKFMKTKFGMIKLKFDKKLVKNLGNNIRIRDEKYQDFRNEFNYSATCNTYLKLSNMAKNNYSDMLLGSDQLWLPVNVIADYYTLNWVPDSINKISYSTSFGISEIPQKYEHLYKQFLKRINHVSVREETGVKIIEKLGIHANLVCDPTLLLSSEQWKKEALDHSLIKERYILCYFLGNNIEHRKFAERLRAYTGYKIISLNHADEYVKYSDSYADHMPYDVGPREWLSLIEHAEYICTDSFHGTVFSLLFNKIFFCFKRYSTENKMSTNSRLHSLLKILDVNENRILNGSEDVHDVIAYDIDYQKINTKIGDVREQSIKWLLNSLGYDRGDKIGA